MNLSRADSVKLLVSLGIQKARAWDEEKLQSKLNTLNRDQMEEEYQQPDTEECLELCEKVFTHLEEGGKIMVNSFEDDFDGDDDSGSIAVAVKEKTKTKKEKKEKVKEDKPKKEKVDKPKKTVSEKDRYGSGLETNAHNINQVLLTATKPLTVKEITEKSGAVKSSVPPHLKNLVAKGWVEKVEDGYVGLKVQKEMPKIEKSKKEKIETSKDDDEDE